MAEPAKLRFVVGADHAGVALKDALKAHLVGVGHAVEDIGTQGTASVDYPDFAHRLARTLLGGNADRGLLVCGSGVGMSMAVNRHRGVRAVVCSEPYSARMARAHNDANVLCLGARVVGDGLATQILDAFVETPFEGGRHGARVKKIDGDGA